MPTLDAVAQCEERAAYLRTLQLTLGDALLQLQQAVEISKDDSCWRAELRGRIWGLRFALEKARS